MSRKRLVIFVTIVVAIIVISSIFLPLFLITSSKISDNDLLSYAREYLSQYHGLVEAHYSLILSSSNSSSMSNFPLYANYPNEIVGSISRTHGAVLFFDYSQTAGNVTDIKEILNPVEYYLWPSMPANTSGLPWVLIKHADTDYVLDSPVSIPYGLLCVESGANLRYVGSGHAFNITGLGAITIFGSLVEENKMILKGSNDKDEWSISQARLDSLSAFISDCKGVLNDSDIKNIQTTYECAFLLDRILSLLSSGKYQDNPWLFTQDYEKLRNAGADNATLTKVETDYIEMQETRTPSLTDSVWAFFVDHVLGGMIIGTVLGGLIVGLLLRGRTDNTERTQPSHGKARHGKHQNSQACGNDARTSLECFKDQPPILKRPTTLTKIRQLNQTLQRDRLNATTLHTDTNKQTNLSQNVPLINTKPPHHPTTLATTLPRANLILKRNQDTATIRTNTLIRKRAPKF